MNKAVLNSMTLTEKRFVRETSREALARLDEEETLKLLTRARRMRDKYVDNYRKGAAAAVAERGGRGASYAEHQRNREKAEVFETSLARVSRRLGALAAASAAELRRERIEAARDRDPGPTPPLPEPAGEPERTPRSARREPIEVKRDASIRARGKRNQARRDSR